jgi:hypothetical protein
MVDRGEATSMWMCTGGQFDSLTQDGAITEVVGMSGKRWRWGSSVTLAILLGE